MPRSRHPDPPPPAVTAPADLLSGKEWQLAAGKIGPADQHRTAVASPAQRTAIAAALSLISLNSLAVDYRVRTAGKGRFRVAGTLKARLTQPCVVTTLPVEQRIEEELLSDFWPVEQILTVGGTEVAIDPDSADPPEPMTDDRINLGALVFDTLALAIAPYPRHPSADEGIAAGTAAADTATVIDERPPSPFAVLAKLKKDGGA